MPGAMCSEAYKLGIEAATATVIAENGRGSAQHCLPLSQCTDTHKQTHIEEDEELSLTGDWAP